MAVLSVKKYKYIKDSNNNKIKVQKSKEEYNKETKKGTCIWYFKVYYKDLYNKTRQYKSKTFASKEEAEEKQALFIINRDNPNKVKFRIVALDYFEKLRKIRKESTVYTYIKDYNKNIAPYFDDYDINSINISQLKKWMDLINKSNFKLSFKNKLYNILKCILDHAIKNYGLKTNQLQILGRFQEKSDKVIKDEEKIRYITKEEFNIFIESIDDILWRTFFIFAFYTGCRKGEIVALKWEDIDFNNNEISINKTLYEDIKGEKLITSTKNNLNRKIKMSKILRNELLNYKENMKKFSDFKETWFVFGCTNNLSKTTIDRKKHIYFQKANVKEITMHEFRHSHVSLLINEYVKTSKEKNMKVDTTKFFLMMSNRLGHSVQVMQRTYMHLFPTIQDEIVDLLDNL